MAWLLVMQGFVVLRLLPGIFAGGCESVELEPPGQAAAAATHSLPCTRITPAPARRSSDPRRGVGGGGRSAARWGPPHGGPRTPVSAQTAQQPMTFSIRMAELLRVAAWSVLRAFPDWLVTWAAKLARFSHACCGLFAATKRW